MPQGAVSVKDRAEMETLSNQSRGGRSGPHHRYGGRSSTGPPVALHPGVSTGPLLPVPRHPDVGGRLGNDPVAWKPDVSPLQPPPGPVAGDPDVRRCRPGRDDFHAGWWRGWWRLHDRRYRRHYATGGCKPYRHAQHAGAATISREHVFSLEPRLLQIHVDRVRIAQGLASRQGARRDIHDGAVETLPDLLRRFRPVDHRA